MKNKLMNEVETEQTSTSAGAEPAPTPVEVKKEKIVRNVTMENGSVINFGARANLLSLLDLEENKVSFFHSNGKVVEFTQPDVPATEDEPAFEFSKFPEFFRKAFLYGVMERVKSSTGPIKEVDKIYEEISKQVNCIKEGQFYIRSVAGEEEETTLSDVQKAYALAKAQLQADQFAHWADTENETVVKEVLDVWEAFTPKDKNKIRSNFVVMKHLADIKQAKAGKATNDLI